MVQIIPTLFSTTEEAFRQRLSKLSSSSLFKEGWVQLDLMDNKFVPTLSIGLDIIKKYPNPFKKEAQLMVINPEEWINGLFDLKVDRIIFPVEIKEKIWDYINVIKDNKIEVGLSLNPDTGVDELDDYLDSLDAVLLMAVNPGQEKQQFNSGTYEKISLIKQRSLNMKVGVDGGVNNTNIKQLVDAGADYVAIGSYLFEGDIDENLENLWEAIR